MTVVDDFVTPENVAEYLASACAMLSTPSIASGRKRRAYRPVSSQGAAGDLPAGGVVRLTNADPGRGPAKTIQIQLAAKLRERLKSQFGVVKNSKVSSV